MERKYTIHFLYQKIFDKYKAKSKWRKQMKIHKVALCGGPCGGKTSSLEYIKSYFEGIGWKVLLIPETASLILGSGFQYSDIEKSDGVIKFQENVLRTIISLENTIFDAADQLANLNNQNILILCDRGTMDIMGFIGKEKWKHLMEKNKNEWNEIDLRDRRYDQILYLQSAAVGAEEFYTLTTNPNRSEDVDLARYLDQKALDAWLGHPALDLVDNRKDPKGFEGKLIRALQFICLRTGVENKLNTHFRYYKKRFLLEEEPNLIKNSVEHRKFTIYFHYLSELKNNCFVRLKKKGYENHWSYSIRYRSCTEGGRTGKLIKKKTLNSSQYAETLMENPSVFVSIYRREFIYKGQYFHLDVYGKDGENNIVILQTFTDNEKEIEIPSFVHIRREITNDKNFISFAFSRKFDMKNVSILNEID
ncbi:hypothetical protein SNEBB_003129 [Seison nebaliae]|nr:hypothetical protein SNEBB_003129 [Seison nebaliae]